MSIFRKENNFNILFIILPFIKNSTFQKYLEKKINYNILQEEGYNIAF